MKNDIPQASIHEGNNEKVMEMSKVMSLPITHHCITWDLCLTGLIDWLCTTHHTATAFRKVAMDISTQKNIYITSMSLRLMEILC